MQIPTYNMVGLSPRSTPTSSEHLNANSPLQSAVRTYDSAWETAVDLAATYGYNSLVSFALDQKKRLFFSSTGRAFIGYVVQGNVILAIGDPIGPPEELALILTEFLAFWRARHKAIAFWQVREELLDLYCDQRLHNLKIGEDTIIDISNFTLKGGKMANVRTSARRAEKSGIRAVFYPGPITSTTHRAQMAHISRAWLTRKGGREMGFSMGRFELETTTDQITALAVDEHDTVHAFLTFIPIYGRNGWGLDLLRRNEEAVPGTIELLLVNALEHFKDQGATMMSLGLAPLSNHNQSPIASLDHCCSLLARRSRTFRHFQTLTAFKRKFQPTWENRYLIFSHPLSLGQIGLALHAVHQQER
jgi:phosphatidylglycerol lysyltransferase